MSLHLPLPYLTQENVTQQAHAVQDSDEEDVVEGEVNVVKARVKGTCEDNVVDTATLFNIESSPPLAEALPCPSARLPFCSSPRLSVSPSPRLPVSPSPRLPVSPSPRLPVSPSPRLPVSPSPRLPVSPSPRLPVSPSPRLPVSPSPRLPVSPSPRLPSPRLPVSPSPRLLVSPSPRLPVSPSPRLPVSPSPRLPVSTGSHLAFKSHVETIAAILDTTRAVSTSTPQNPFKFDDRGISNALCDVDPTRIVSSPRLAWSLKRDALSDHEATSRLLDASRAYDLTPNAIPRPHPQHPAPAQLDTTCTTIFGGAIPSAFSARTCSVHSAPCGHSPIAYTAFLGSRRSPNYPLHHTHVAAALAVAALHRQPALPAACVLRPLMCRSSASPGYHRHGTTPTRLTPCLRALGARRAALDAIRV
ncbi:hypothetical protein B0H19DRAFT_1274695 [Mycena capillaripes]|nr:hypothetical protein B0H19DRAFT_1274695 [Mycena capillaripes]